MNTLTKAAAERRQKIEDRFRCEEEAAKRGTLWTIMAVLYPERAFVVIYNRRNEDLDTLMSQHPECHAALGPVFFIGSKLMARQEACKLINSPEITIRVIA